MYNKTFITSVYRYRQKVRVKNDYNQIKHKVMSY